MFVISLSFIVSAQLNFGMYCSDTNDHVTLQGSKRPATVNLNCIYNDIRLHNSAISFSVISRPLVIWRLQT